MSAPLMNAAPVLALLLAASACDRVLPGPYDGEPPDDAGVADDASPADDAVSALEAGSADGTTGGCAALGTPCTGHVCCADPTRDGREVVCPATRPPLCVYSCADGRPCPPDSECTLAGALWVCYFPR